jgi:hypothetical protein
VCQTFIFGTYTGDDNGKQLAIHSECQGACGRVFQAVGVAIPPTIREI